MRSSVAPSTSVSDILGQHVTVVYYVLIILGAVIVFSFLYYNTLGRKYRRRFLPEQRDGNDDSRSHSSKRLNERDQLIASFPPGNSRPRSRFQSLPSVNGGLGHNRSYGKPTCHSSHDGTLSFNATWHQLSTVDFSAQNVS